MRHFLGLLLAVGASAAALPRPSDIPLTAETAVEVALSRAPAMKAARARAEAERAEAKAEGRPEEPRLAAYHEAGHGEGRTQFALTFDLWSLIGYGRRSGAAKASVRRADALLAESALALSAETKAALYEVQAASAAFILRRQAAEVPGDAAASAQGQINLVQAEAELEIARSRLSRLMRVPTNSGWWTLANLPEPPDSIPDAAALSTLARERRPSVQAALEAAKAANERARAWSSANAGNLRLGIASEKQPDGSRLTGPAVEMDIPLFASMLPRLQAVEARSQEAQAQADDADAELIADLETLRARLSAAQKTVALCRDALIPARAHAAAKSSSIESNAALLVARLEGLNALKDYWTTRVALEGAVGGSIDISEEKK